MLRWSSSTIHCSYIYEFNDFSLDCHRFKKKKNNPHCPTYFRIKFCFREVTTKGSQQVLNPYSIKTLINTTVHAPDYLFSHLKLKTSHICDGKQAANQLITIIAYKKQTLVKQSPYTAWVTLIKMTKQINSISAELQNLFCSLLTRAHN